jgi:hypothetical protein
MKYIVLVTSMVEVEIEPQDSSAATTLVLDQVDTLRDRDPRVRWRRTMAGFGMAGGASK